MFKTLKWIYRLGVRHERQRVRLLIAEYRKEKPERPAGFGDKDTHYSDDYDRQIAVWYEVSETLKRLIEPDWGKTQVTEIPRIPLEDD